MSKRPRTLDGFFGPPAPKKQRASDDVVSNGDKISQNHPSTKPIVDLPANFSSHTTYPFEVKELPQSLQNALSRGAASTGLAIDSEPDLDLLYFQPFVPKQIASQLTEFLRDELFFYRVKYTIKRGTVETAINTPRYTTVFGVDETSRFDGERNLVDAASGRSQPGGAYRCKPRPIPQCLDFLRQVTETVTGCQFNFVLVNYYANGDDSISYHSDDEKFLGQNPAIASFSLGAKRDFLLKHKPTPDKHSSEVKPMKFPLASGDMILMRGRTQSNWLHSIPKRKGGEADRGRINITFRRALVKGGTENYYRYNVGDGVAYKWDARQRDMAVWPRAP